MLHSISLAGDWDFALDPDGTTVAGRRDALDLPPHLALPGTIALPGSVDIAAMAPADDRRTMDHLVRRHPYVGCAWYRRTVEIPSDQDGLYHWLVLERPHGETNVYLNGRKIGRDRSLCTAHRFLLGHLSPGVHTLVLMIDNARAEAVGNASARREPAFEEIAHSMTDHTQTNWNGVVGELRIEAAAARIEALRIDAPTHEICIRAELEAFDPSITWPTFWNEAAEDHIEIAVHLDGVDAPVTYVEPVKITSAWTPFDVCLALPADTATWDEFAPRCHRLVICWVRDGRTLDSQEASFGIRDVRREGRHLILNGRRLSLRGTLDCAIFPKTGHPPADVAEWRRIFEVCRDHGLNHMRFHSWCPPRAAFVAGDELGILLAVEGPVWPVLHADPNLDDFVHQEAVRIFRDYGNHPSFALFAIGNELHGDGMHAFVSRFVTRWKAEDPRRVYAGGSGWPTTPEADYQTKPEPRSQRWGEGMAGRLTARALETRTDWREWVEDLDHPLMVHETGQWCVYPDLASIERFDGPLAARNLEMVRDDLAARGRLDEADVLLRASGALQIWAYKEEIEACLRTSDFLGFQLLGLQDFPGQGTALVGVVDAFWEPKPYLDSAVWREFCAQVVPLWRTDGFVVAAGEPLRGDVQVSQFAREAIPAGELVWTVRDEAGATVASGVLGHEALEPGTLHDLGALEIDTVGLAVDARHELELSLGAGGVNRWAFWTLDPTPAPELAVRRTLDEDVLTRLANGERLVFAPDPVDIVESSVLGFAPIFWNTLWTEGQPPHTLGLWIDAEHAALADFPTREHSETHWWPLMADRRAMTMDGLPGRPIVGVVDDWNTNRDLFLLTEVAVGTGRLVISAMPLDSGLVPAAMARSLAAYLASDASDVPATSPDALIAWWAAQSAKRG